MNLRGTHTFCPYHYVFIRCLVRLGNKIGNKVNELTEYNPNHLKCGNPSYKFKSNIMLFTYLKHKGSTEDVSVLVSIYKYAMTSSLRTKLVGGRGRTCEFLVPAGRVNQSSFTNTHGDTHLTSEN